MSSFRFIIKQQWTIEEISIFSNSSHLEWRVGLSDTILKGTHPRTIHARFGLIWFRGFRGEDLNVKVYDVRRTDGHRTPSDGKSSPGQRPGELKTCHVTLYLNRAMIFFFFKQGHEAYSIQLYVIKFVNDLLQVGGFLMVLRFPQPIKLTATI